MPLEIKELHIKASVGDEGSSEVSSPESSFGDSDAVQKIIADCVQQVMEILRDKKER